VAWNLNDVRTQLPIFHQHNIPSANETIFQAYPSKKNRLGPTSKHPMPEEAEDLSDLFDLYLIGEK
jgi:hypothetical protein